MGRENIYTLPATIPKQSCPKATVSFTVVERERQRDREKQAQNGVTCVKAPHQQTETYYLS